MSKGAAWWTTLGITGLSLLAIYIRHLRYIANRQRVRADRAEDKAKHLENVIEVGDMGDEEVIQELIDGGILDPSKWGSRGRGRSSGQ